MTPAIILASAALTIIAYGFFCVGAQGDDLTPDQIMHLGDPRQADVMNPSSHGSDL